MSALVQIEDGSVTYPSTVPVHALRHIDFTVDEGEHVAVMGRSGSGKTTLLNVVGLLRVLTGGSYRFRGQVVEQLTERRRTELRATEIGFVFQSFHLLEHRTVLENVAAGLLYRGVGQRERLARAATALKDLNLSHRRDFLPPQLSGGEQQRVVIARALVGDPSLLLCDEPTGDLDSGTAAEVLALIDQQVQRGRAVVVITHDPAVAAVASRTLHVADGQLGAALTEPR